MTRPISFLGEYPWSRQPGGRRNRPYSEVVLNSPRGMPPLRVLMVVDTGADHMLINENWLRRTGYIGTGHHVGPVKLALAGGGYLLADEYTNIDAEIEGNRVALGKVHASPQAVDLLGLSAILTATNVGFDNRAWLYT